jgi:hypothetical protein
MQKVNPHIEKSSIILNGMSHKPNKTKQKVLNVMCEPNSCLQIEVVVEV